MAAVLNRRSFFGLLGAVAAGAAFDPERALWVRGAKVYSIPAPKVRFELVTLCNNTQVARALRGDYGNMFSPDYPHPLRIGDVIFAPVPDRFLALCLDGSYLLHRG